MIRTETIDNACCIYEAEGFKLVSDPWLTDGAFEGSWGHLKIDTRDAKAEAMEKVTKADALYISHLHPDHFDPDTLIHFRRDIPIYIYQSESRFNVLEKKLRALQFTKIILLGDRETEKVGPFNLTMFGPFCDHPFDPSDLGYIIDSAILLEYKGYRVLNTNDNTLDEESAKLLTTLYGPIQHAQLKYGLAGPYPQCCLNLNPLQKRAERDRLLLRWDHYNKKIASLLQADIVEPFAGDYYLIGNLTDLNQWVGIPGVEDRRRRGWNYQYEVDSWPNRSELQDMLYQGMKNVITKKQELGSRVPLEISINGLYHGQLETKLEGRVDFELDNRLLYSILKRKAHWNNASVGSHIRFSRTPNVYHPDLEMLLSFLHV